MKGQQYVDNHAFESKGVAYAALRSGAVQVINNVKWLGPALDR